MRMARVNVYLPDDLAREARAADLNVSNLAQEALRSALTANRTTQWLAEVAALDPTGVDHDTVLMTVAAVKHEFEGHD